jgi:hypothetical protein
MNAPPPAEESETDQALQAWRQGDVTLEPQIGFVHWADLARPQTEAARQLAQDIPADQQGQASMPTVVQDDAVAGFVVLSQTCDIVRQSKQRPYVEVAPLIEVEPDELERVRRLGRPALAYIPATAARRLVADLDRSMTVEKAIVASWRRVPGWATDAEAREFAKALARRRQRFAFPDDFVSAARAFEKRFRDKHNRNSPEGAHMRALMEIRVLAAPSWDEPSVRLTLWFITDSDPAGMAPDWTTWIEQWAALVDQSGRFRVETAMPCRLEDMTGRDYFDSDRLEFDQLSTAGETRSPVLTIGPDNGRAGPQ